MGAAFLSDRVVGAELIPGAGLVLGAALQAIAIDPSPDAGMNRTESDQLAMQWAVRREAVLRPTAPFAALYELSTGAFLGRFVISSDGRILSPYAEEDGPRLSAVAIVGNGPTVTPTWPTMPGEPRNWPQNLSRALDHMIARLGQQNVGPEEPFRAMPGVLPAVGVYMLFAGGAAAVLTAGVAAWRYFDPEYRVQAATIDAASQAYTARLATYAQTGQMVEPSPIETSAQAIVENAAKQADQTGWILTAGVSGGIAAGTLLAGFLGARR